MALMGVKNGLATDEAVSGGREVEQQRPGGAGQDWSAARERHVVVIIVWSERQRVFCGNGSERVQKQCWVLSGELRAKRLTVSIEELTSCVPVDADVGIQADRIATPGETRKGDGAGSEAC